MNKERHILVTIWLILMLVSNSLAILYNLFGIGFSILFNLNNDQSILFGVIGIANILFIIFVLCWKMIGILGLGITTTIKVFVFCIEYGKSNHEMYHFLYDDNLYRNTQGTYLFSTIIAYCIGLAFITLGFSVLLSLMKIKIAKYSTWDYLIGNYSKKTIKNKKCRQCETIFSEHSICPKCGSSFWEETNTKIENTVNTEIIANIKTFDDSNITYKKCKKCGEKVQEDIFKCPKCKYEAFI